MKVQNIGQNNNQQNPFNINICFSINPKGIMKAQNRSAKKNNKIDEINYEDQQQHIISNRNKIIEGQIFSKELIQIDQTNKSKKKKKQMSADIKLLGQSIKHKQIDKNIKIHSKSYFPSQQKKLKNSNQFKKKSIIKNQIKSFDNRLAWNNNIANSFTRQNQSTERTKKIASLKLFINNIVKKELNKQTIKKVQTSRLQKSKNKKKSRNKLKSSFQGNKSKTMKLQEFLMKLSSIKSINNSILRSDQEQLDQLDPRKDIRCLSRAITWLQTQQSTKLMKQIHEFEKRQIQKRLRQNNSQKNILNKMDDLQTKKIIQSYIAILNQDLIIQGSIKLDKKISQLDKKIIKDNQIKQNVNYMQKVQLIQSNSQDQLVEIQDNPNQLNQQQNQFQKLKYMFNQILQNINQKSNKKQLLNSITQFLAKSQNNINQIVNQNQIKNQQQSIVSKQHIINELYHQQIDLQEIDSQDNSSIGLVNLQSIDKILKNRYSQLISKKNKQIFQLETRLDLEKINQEEFKKEKDNIQKWINNQTKYILNAKKDIWRGYNQLKNILKKAQFHQSVSHCKSQSMLHCLSDQYLEKLKHLPYSQIQKQSFKIQQKKDQLYGSELQLIKNNQKKILTSPVLLNTPQSKQQMSSSINYQQIDQQLNKDQSSDAQFKSYDQQQQQFEKPNQIINKKIDITRKFKFLSSDDKQDIFEFIFLDICIELYQEPSKGNKIMDTINKFINYKKQSKKSKGVRTNINVVKQYLKRFISYVLRTQRQTLKNINTPMGPTAKQMLKYMRDLDDQYINQDQVTVAVIISIQIFDKFQRSLLSALQFEPFFEDTKKQAERVQFLKNVLHIHNKALFDCLNQCLDHQRPFGIWGLPFPWKVSHCQIRIFSEQQIENKLKKCMDIVSQYCSYVCGLIVDKQQSLISNHSISQDYLQSIRQDRLSRMLANQLLEQQDRWLFFDDEQAEILIQLSKLITMGLLVQATFDILGLKLIDI